MKVKAYPQTQLEELFSACAARLSVNISKLKFFDTNVDKLCSGSSLQEAGINDGDCIECLVEQVGD